MKKSHFIALASVLLLSSFFAHTVSAALVVSPGTGHTGITVTLSDNLGGGSVNLDIGAISFGTLQITVATHDLTPVRGTLNGNAIVTDANGEYHVRFTVPNLTVGAYSIRVGARTTLFNLTNLILDPTVGRVGIRLKVSGEYGVPNADLGALQFDTTEITQTTQTLNVSKGTLGGDLKSIFTDGAGEYEATFEVPDHIAGVVSVAVNPLVEAGTTTADGTTTTLIASGLASNVDDFYNTLQLIITGGSVSAERATIVDYDGGTKTITVGSPFSAPIVSGVTFRIERRIASQTTFTVRGSITDITPTTVEFGDLLTVNGKGFHLLDTLTIEIGYQTFIIPQGAVDASGNFSASVTISDGKWSASHDVTVSGNVSGNSITLAGAAVIQPSIELNPTSGSRNTILHVTGHNFSGDGNTIDEIVRIDFGTTTTIVEARQADFGGNPPGKFAVSFVAGLQTVGGTIQITARGTISTPDGAADFLYSLPSSNRVLELSEPSGSPGKNDLIITGTGYPNETNIGRPVLKPATSAALGLTILAYTFGTDPVAPESPPPGTQIQTDADGKFRVTVQLPSPVVAGGHTIFVSEDFDGDGILDGNTAVSDDVPLAGPFDGVNEDLNDNGILDYLTPSQSFSLVPQITVAANQSGFVGQTFSASGVGFGASEIVDVKLSDDSVTGSITTDVNGSFGLQNFQINTQTNGDKIVSTTGRTTQLTTIGNETVKVLNRVSEILPATGSNIAVGQAIALSGDGWGSGETIEVTIVSFGGVVLNLPVSVALIPATSNLDGTLSVSFIVPSLGGTGTVDIFVRGVTTNDSQTAIDRGGGAVLQWNLTGGASFPIIDVSPTSGKVGDTVNVTIFNPAPAGNITFDGDEVVVSPVPAAPTFAVPAKPAGTYLIRYNSSEVPFAITGEITNVTPPNIIGFADTGGGATTVTTPVPHRLNNGMLTTVSGTTNYNGTFIVSNVTSNTFDIPTAFVADDGTGTLHANVGDLVTVAGTGYGDLAPVTILFDGLNVATVTSGSNGSFTGTFPVPPVPAGAPHTTTAVGSGQTDTFSLPNTYVIGEISSLDPVTGTTLTPITLTGNGLGANEDLTVTFDGSSVIRIGSAFSTNGNGEFTANFMVPSNPFGAGTITVTGTTSGQTSTVAFTLQPAIELITSHLETALTGIGASGINYSMVLVRGTGFATTDTVVALHFGDDTDITPVTQDNGTGNALINDGKFFVQFNIDGVTGAAFHPAGSTTVTAVGNGSGEQAFAVFNVLGRITSVLGVSTGNTTGQVGDEVEVMGDGFASNENLIIDFGQTETIPISSSDTRARDDGTFTTRFRIDKQAYGLKDLTVRQGSGVSATQNDAVRVIGRLTRLLINGSPRSDTNKTVHVGDAITIIGDGYGAGHRLALKLSGITLTVANNAIQNEIVGSDGSFATTFKVHQIVAAQNLDIAVDDPVQITPANLRNTTIPADTDGENDVGGLDLTGRITSVTPASGTSTTAITIAGDGFHVNATTRTITIPGISMAFGTPTIATNGAFSFTGTLSSLPGLPPLGSVTFEVTTTGGTPAFTVTDSNSQFILSEASAKRIDVTPLFGTSDDTISVTGTGFDVSANVGQITFEGVVISATAAGIGTVESDNTIITDTNGAFQVSATVPAVTGGPKVVDTSGVAALTPVTFDVQAKLVVLTPASGVGTVDTTVTVRGTGFAASEIRRLRFDDIDLTNTEHGLASDGIGNVITNINSSDLNKVFADVQGRFRVRFNVPVAASGISHTVTTDGGGVANFTIEPRLTLVSPASLQNASILRAAGDGFRVNEQVKIDFGSQVVRLNANTQGQFDTNTPISSDGSFVVTRQSHGEKSVTISGTEGGVILAGFFAVEPRLTVSGIIGSDGSFISGTTSGPVGVGVRVRGDGFTSNDFVFVQFGTTERIATPLSDSNGEFTTEFTVDSQPGSLKEIAATGANGEIASTAFTVTARLQSINDVEISPVGFTPIDVKIGDLVTLHGDGLRANENISILTGVANILSGAAITVGNRANENGEFTTTFVVPQMSSGPKTIRLTTSSVMLNTVGIRVVGEITNVSPTTGGDGTTVFLSGRGFDVAENVAITMTAANNIAAMVESTGLTSSIGAFTNFSFTILNPSGFASGPVTIRAATSTTFDTTNQFIFSVGGVQKSTQTVVTLTSATVPTDPGGLNVTPGIFTINGTSLTIVAGDTVQALINQINGAGINVTAPLTGDGQLQLIPTGTATIALADGTSNFVSIMIFVRDAKLTVFENDQATVGSVLRVRGIDYPTTTNVGRLAIKTASGDVLLSVTDAGAGSIISGNAIQTDSNGVFEVSFVVPSNTLDSVAGTKILDTVPISSVAQDTFEIIPKLTISPTGGLKGTIVTVSGTGFSPEQPNRKVRIGITQELEVGSNSVEVGDVVQANAFGVFSTVVTMPTSGPASFAGNHEITIDSGFGNSVSGGFFTIYGSAELTNVNPPNGSVGQLVTANGSGFAPGETVTLSGVTGLPTNTVANNQGEISFNFTVGQQSGGSKTILAVGGTPNNQTTAPFTVTGQIANISPIAGTKGTSIRVRGNGCPINSTITLDFGSQISIASTGVAGDGTFNLTFQVPEHPRGNMVITVNNSLSSVPSQTATFTVESAISASVTSANVGDVITISGSGFAANEIVTVQIGVETRNVTADTNGSFTVNFNIPALPNGTIQVTAIGGDGTVPSLTTSFTVSPKIILSATSGNPNDNIIINGTGFNSGKNVRIKVDATVPTSLATIAVNGVGSFDPTTVNIPATATGTLTIRVENIDGTALAGDGLINSGLEAMITVVQPPPPGGGGNSGSQQPQATVTLTPTTGRIGSTIQVSGTGYNSNETVNISFGNQTIVVNANTSGALTNVSLVIATQVGGDRSLFATGASSGRGAFKTFTIEPQITTFSPLEADIGQTVFLQGDGFRGTEGLTLFLGDTQSNITPIPVIMGDTTRSDGTFSLSFAIPILQFTSTPGSDKKISSLVRINSGTGLTTGTVQFVKINTQNASLQASPNRVAPDETVTLTGLAVSSNGIPLVNGNLGFLLLVAPNGSQVTITELTHDLRMVGNVGSIAADSSARTNEIGMIQVIFSLAGAGTPPLSGGTAALRFTGVTNLETTIEIQPQVVFLPLSAVAGAAIIVSGSGYRPNETIQIFLETDGSESQLPTTPAAVTTDADGQFGTNTNIVSFVILPETLGGRHRIIAKGSITNNPLNTPTIAVDFTVIGAIDVPASGAPVSVGDQLQITGRGLGADEEISISLGGVHLSPAPVGGEPGAFSPTTATGGFHATVVIPVLSKGLRTLRVTGTTSGATADTLVITIPKVVSVGPLMGSIGTEVLIEGTGFAANGAISVDLGSQTNVAIGSASADGSVNFTFIVNQSPPINGQTLTIRIGSDTETRTFEFIGDVSGPAIAEVTHDGGAGVIIAAGRTINIRVVQRDSFDIAASGTFQIGDAISGTLHNDGQHSDGAADDTVWAAQHEIAEGDVTKTDGVTGPVPITAILVDENGNQIASDSIDSINIDTVAEILDISIAPGNPFAVDETISITVVSEPGAMGTFQIDGVTKKIPLTEGNLRGQYKGKYTVQEGDSATAAKVIVEMTDAFGHTVTQEDESTIIIDASVILSRVVLVSPEANSLPFLQSGDSLTVEFTTDTGSTATLAILSQDRAESVPIDVVSLNAIKPQPVDIPGGTTRYSALGTISPDTRIGSGMHFIRLTVTDLAGNTSATDVIEVEFDSSSHFQLNVPAGTGLIHIPLAVTRVNDQPLKIKRFSDLYDALGGRTNVNLLLFYEPPAGEKGSVWQSYIGDVSKGTPFDALITPDMGVITVMKQAVTLNLRGNALGEDEVSQIKLTPGTNLVGIPLENENLQRVSDLLRFPSIGEVITAVLVSDEGKFKVVARPGDDGDIPLIGGQSFIITTRGGAEAEITGTAWQNSPVASSPVASSGILRVDQTPVLAVHGKIIAQVDNPTGGEFSLSNARYHITVHNRSTGTVLTTSSRGSASDGTYAVTFVDALRGRAARAGDVLAIDVRVSTPRIRVRPIRQVVSTDDVQQSVISPPDLIAYEIPEKTALLGNYPNPFNPETWIPYQLVNDGVVVISIYDVTGRLVRQLDLGHQFAGHYANRTQAAHWNGRNQSGEVVAGGLYFYTLKTQDFQATRRMFIVK